MSSEMEMTMVDQFPIAMGFYWRPENDGQALHTTPKDPGGATAWGVTFNTYVAWQTLHHEAADFAVFKAALKEDFLPLYRAMYWNATRCGNMGVIGIQLFDIAANCGPGNAARFIQSVVGAKVDGELGPTTMAAINAVDPVMLNVALAARREAYYHALPTFKTFGGGWDRRAEDCRAFVSSLLANKH